ncbi:MAG: cytochrome c oxidase assembly protein [Vulcanimicrobiaceae bacterium]
MRRRSQDAALGAAIAVLVLVLGPWFDRLADRSFAWHMAQHIAIMMIAAPLFLLGAPLRRLLAALPRSAARRVSRFLQHPVVQILNSPFLAWLALPITLYVAHFSPLYEAALERDPIHAFEHGLFFAAALCYWNPILAVAPSPHALSYPVRIFYVFISMPVQGFLGLALYSINHPLYPYYERELGVAAAMLDQAYGAELMWVATGFFLVIPFLVLVFYWLRAEERLALLADRQSLS